MRGGTEPAMNGSGRPGFSPASGSPSERLRPVHRQLGGAVWLSKRVSSLCRANRCVVIAFIGLTCASGVGAAARCAHARRELG